MTIRLFCLIVLFAFSISARSQGCSDAGFCTMGAMKPDQHYSKKLNLKLRSMELSFYRGTTTLTPIVKSVTADLNFSLNKKNTFQVKLPYQWVDGRLGSTQDFGDISICFTRNLVSKEGLDLNFSLGGKIPTNNSDKTIHDQTLNKDLPLPMYYQTSLGTYDVISGLSLINRKWLFATGIQIPMNENKNQFLWGKWAGSSEEQAYVNRYSKSKELKRGIDVMLRVERNFRFSRLNFSMGLLPIYRIGVIRVPFTNYSWEIRDEITDPTGKRVKPNGTSGLALSGIVTAGYSFSVRTGIKVLVGHKITQRYENPDGLTRHLVTSFTYFYRF